MKLKLLWDKSLPGPEVTVASVPEDDEATRILEAPQSAAGSTFAYVEKAGTSKERVPFACICSLEASDEGPFSTRGMAGRSSRLIGCLRPRDARARRVQRRSALAFERRDRYSACCRFPGRRRKTDRVKTRSFVIARLGGGTHQRRAECKRPLGRGFGACAGYGEVATLSGDYAGISATELIRQ